MAEASDKGALIEKLIFAAIPILFSCVVYLFSALNSAQYNLREIEKEAALARAEIKLNFQTSIDQAALARAQIFSDVDLLKEKIEGLQKTCH
jgi:hypothetical protein